MLIVRSRYALVLPHGERRSVHKFSNNASCSYDGGDGLYEWTQSWLVDTKRILRDKPTAAAGRPNSNKLGDVVNRLHDFFRGATADDRERPMGEKEGAVCISLRPSNLDQESKRWTSSGALSLCGLLLQARVIGRRCEQIGNVRVPRHRVDQPIVAMQPRNDVTAVDVPDVNGAVV
jgi:hypothetical protein